jgi:hypothetical protein
MYGHIWCKYAVLANLSHVLFAHHMLVCCRLVCLQDGAQSTYLPNDFASKPELFPFWKAGISGQGQVSAHSWSFLFCFLSRPVPFLGHSYRGLLEQARADQCSFLVVGLFFFIPAVKDRSVPILGRLPLNGYFSRQGQASARLEVGLSKQGQVSLSPASI